jgi:hypothetical protein
LILAVFRDAVKKDPRHAPNASDGKKPEPPGDPICVRNLPSATYPPGGSDKVDIDEADEVIVAIAKTVAEQTSRQDGLIRQQLIDQLMSEIMNYDAEFRREDSAGTIGSHARH